MASGSSIRPEPGFLAETGSYKSYNTRIPAQHGGQTKGRAEPHSKQRHGVLLPAGLEAPGLGVAETPW